MSAIKRIIFGQNPRRTAVLILVLAGISFILFRWVLIPIRTQGSSMLPTFTPDRLHFVNRLSYGTRGPERGDIYFGSGDEAGRLAGGTKHPARYFVLLPRNP